MLAMLAGMSGGIHGATSALLGGSISVLGGVASSRILEVGRNRSRRQPMSMSAAAVLLGALKAELVRVTVIVLMLWLVFTFYKDVSALGFIGTFAVTTVIYSLAIAVPDK